MFFLSKIEEVYTICTHILSSQNVNATLIPLNSCNSTSLLQKCKQVNIMLAHKVRGKVNDKMKCHLLLFSMTY